MSNSIFFFLDEEIDLGIENYPVSNSHSEAEPRGNTAVQTATFTSAKMLHYFIVLCDSLKKKAGLVSPRTHLWALTGSVCRAPA